MSTQERLKELIYYHPESGDFIWLVSQGRAQAGRQAGCLDEQGYVRIKIDGVKYKAHRLAWVYMTGQKPLAQIDHKNRVRHHNEWSNLREADGVQQNANKGVQRNNACGVRGVSLWKGRWRAVIYKSKKQKFLGYFGSKEDAAAAYREAAQQHFGDFARL
jgi:hypothetical protein